MNALLFILLLIFSSTVWSQDIETLTFYSDDNERMVDAPGEKCVAVIDDSSNYRAELIHGSKVKVTGLGVSDRSATLLVDCEQHTVIYALKFISRSKRSLDLDSSTTVVRPESSIAITARQSSSSSQSIDTEISDRSFKKLQLSIRKGWTEGVRGHQDSESADVMHVFDQSYLGYGVQHTRSGADSNINIRAGAGIYGLALSHSQSTYYNKDQWSQSDWLRLPSSIGLGLGYQRSVSGDESRIADRFFALTSGGVSGAFLTRFVREKFANGKRKDSFQLRAEESVNPETMLRLSNGNLFSCQLGGKCLVNEWILRSLFNFSGSRLQVDYGLLPHTVAIGLDGKIWGRQRANVQLRQSFKEKSFAGRWPYFEESQGVQATSESSGVHLEWTKGQWTFFWDEAGSLMKKSVLSHSVGSKFDGDNFIATLGGSFEPKKPSGRGFYADIRYYFDKNLARFAVTLAKTLIKVNVMSNAPGVAIADAKVDLRQGERVLASRVSSPGGSVEFSEGRCCGDYQIVVSSGEFKGESVAYLTPLSLERTVYVPIYNYRKIIVSFVAKSITNTEERVHVTNFFPEIQEAVVGCNGCHYDGNSIYIPIQGLVELQLNKGLLPFEYEIDNLDRDPIDTRDQSISQIRVTLKDKRR